MARETTVEVDIEVSTKYSEKIKKAEERLKKVNKVASKMNTPKKPLTEMEKYQQSIDKTNRLLIKLEKQQRSIGKLTQIETTLKAKIKIVTTDTESEKSSSDVKAGTEGNGQTQILQQVSSSLLTIQVQMSQTNSFLLMLMSAENMLASQIIQVSQMQMKVALISVNLMLGLQATMNNTNNLLMILFSVGNQLLSVMTQTGQMQIQAVQLIAAQILGFQTQLSQINNLLMMLINLELQFFSQMIQGMQIQLQIMINMLNQLLSGGNSSDSNILKLILNELIKLSMNTQIQAAGKATESCGAGKGVQSAASCALNVTGGGIKTIFDIMGKLNTVHSFLEKFFGKATAEAFAGIVKKIFSLFMANPILAAIAAVIAIFILLYTKCEGFRNVVNAILKFILNLFIQNWEMIKVVVMTAFQIIQKIITIAIEVITDII